MNPNWFKWTDIAAARGLRIAVILLIALVLNRVLHTLTRRLIPPAGSEGIGRIARILGPAGLGGRRAASAVAFSRPVPIDALALVGGARLVR